MTRPRDSQRSKVYDAEDEYRTAVAGQSMREVWETQKWVNCILKSDWWAILYPGIIAIKVKDGRGRRSACGEYLGNGTGTITVPHGFRRKIIILHELAHVVTLSRDGVEPWHGEVFVGRFLDLVDRWMGQLEGLALRWFLSKNRVKWQERHLQKGNSTCRTSLAKATPSQASLPGPLAAHDSAASCVHTVETGYTTSGPRGPMRPRSGARPVRKESERPEIGATFHRTLPPWIDSGRQIVVTVTAIPAFSYNFHDFVGEWQDSQGKTHRGKFYLKDCEPITSASPVAL